MKITCLGGYYINDSWDYPNEDGVVLGIADDVQAIKDWEFFDCREHKFDKSGGLGLVVGAIDGLIVFILPVMDNRFHREPRKHRLPLS